MSRTATIGHCPECAKNGFPETPSMKDSPLCGDCHDLMRSAQVEQAAWDGMMEDGE